MPCNIRSSHNQQVHYEIHGSSTCMLPVMAPAVRTIDSMQFIVVRLELAPTRPTSTEFSGKNTDFHVCITSLVPPPGRRSQTCSQTRPAVGPQSIAPAAHGAGPVRAALASPPGPRPRRRPPARRARGGLDRSNALDHPFARKRAPGSASMHLV